jgi:S-adenosylmethionine decarboxylase
MSLKVVDDLDGCHAEEASALYSEAFQGPSALALQRHLMYPGRSIRRSLDPAGITDSLSVPPRRTPNEAAIRLAIARLAIMIMDDATYLTVAAAATASRRVFGTELVLNLAGCDPEVIGNPEALTAWALQLCDRIGMTPFGQPLINHFGEGDLAGWTLLQLITESDIKVHAVDADNSAFANVFSCRPFDTAEATRFTVGYFRAQRHEVTVLERRAPAGDLMPGQPARRNWNET